MARKAGIQAQFPPLAVHHPPRAHHHDNASDLHDPVLLRGPSNLQRDSSARLLYHIYDASRIFSGLGWRYLPQDCVLIPSAIQVDSGGKRAKLWVYPLLDHRIRLSGRSHHDPHWSVGRSGVILYGKYHFLQLSHRHLIHEPIHRGKAFAT